MADSNRKTSNFLPDYFQTEKNNKFLSSTVDQLINVPQLERINGFIGSKISRNYDASTDVYLPESDYHRKYYQFEPSAVFRNSNSEVTDIVTYDDLIHKMESKHIITDHLDDLFRCSFYSYDPYIDWDKLINFDQYYWLINGPESIILDDIDVVNSILGQITYQLPNNVSLTNGMKLKFGTSVFPLEYRGKEYIVEGVGTGIQLIDFAELTIFESIGTVYDELFDSDLFDSVPFDGDKRIPFKPEYVTINKSSRDQNPWSRYNRWFHKDVVIKTAEANGIQGVVLPDSSLRAKRPIVEFKANIQLNNFGNLGIGFVDLIDTDTEDAFNTVQNSLGYYVDQVKLEKGQRVVFNADRDPNVRSKIYEVDQVLVNGNLRLQLVEVLDSQHDNSVAVKYGVGNFGTSWKFDADTNSWIKSQQHTKLNEGPLFDLFDKDQESYSVKEFTNFSGNKIFGYKSGTQFDEVLEINVQIDNTAGLGSYLFQNYFMTETINFSQNNITVEVKTADTFFKYDNELKNVWREPVNYPLPIIEIQTVQENTSTLTLQSIDAPINLTGLAVRAYNSKNNEPLGIVTSATTEIINITFDNELPANDSIIFKINSIKPPNENGYWEIPKSLTNNPFNGSIADFTLSVLTDHLYSMAERTPDFQGKIQGENNLRDLPDYGKYGSRLIINADPLAFTKIFLGKKEHDVISALEWGAAQHDDFRLSFINYLDKVDPQLSPRDAVDYILTELTKNKDDRSPFFYSDMVGYGTDKITKQFVITNSLITEYPIGTNFDLATNSYEAVYIYKNSAQLINDIDYQFNKIEGTVIFLTSLAVNDEIIIDYYTNTKACFVPVTPSKMAIYPATFPELYFDNSLSVPINTIRCHDGSLLKQFGDYRDDILLEFELRIYNNLKVKYNYKIFDLGGISGGYFKETHISKQEYIDIFDEYLYRWAGKYNIDLFTNSSYDPNNYKTWNYKNSVDVFGNTIKNGSLDYVLSYYFDSINPQFLPWRMLGFYQRPSWWDLEYGAAPYTSGNTKLWNDLELGYIRGEDRIAVDRARPGLSQIIPVDEYGQLKPPFEYLLTENTIRDRQADWAATGFGPAEMAFRRASGIYPFVRAIIAILWDPSTFLSRLFDVSRIDFNSLDQIVYGTNIYLNPKNLIIDRNTTPICGFGSIVLEKGLAIDRDYSTKLKTDLDYLTFNLVQKVGGFVNKEKLQITIDSVDPTSLGIGAILPQEDYDVILNVSDPIDFYSASGIIVQKYNGKFVVKGYDIYRPFFEIFVPYINNNSRTITVGGKPESFTEWTSIVNNSNPAVSSIDLTSAESITSRYYRQGQIVRYNNRFYRVKTGHNATATFETTLFAELDQLPTKGGVTVQRPISFNQGTVEYVPYGTEFTTIQEVYNFIIGYGERLKQQGFIFDDFNNEFNEVLDWNFAAKEFLYWCTQNWADGHLITLSPFANQIQFQSDIAIVDNVTSDYINLNLLKADGRILTKENYTITRDDKLCTIKSKNPNEGMFFVRLNLVQKEHALILNNTTIFNDIIYDIETGLKQQRAKLYGFRTKNWNGDFFSPGFVFDNVKIKDWESYTTYLPSEIVRFNGEYYSANNKITPEETFDFNKWSKLLEKPQSELLPNFEYKINQFEDFYSLDIDNFDYDQQNLAQHLIGYTERSYLTDIFSNPISQYKFYQGFIREKGTINSIERLNKASNYNLQGDMKIAEQWAFRIGDFGSFSSYNELEFNLKENTQIDNNYIVKIVDTLPQTTNPNLTYITQNELVIKPDDFNSENSFVTYNTNYDDSGFLLTDAGYVKDNEVTATAYNKISLLDIANNNLLNEGDVIWLGYLENGGWDVYRYAKKSAQISGVYVSAPGETITFVTNKHHGLKIGDIVSIVNFDNQVNGIHIIVGIPSLNQFSVASSLTTIVDNDLISYGLLYKFESIRFSSFENLENRLKLFEFEEKNKIYIDSNENNKWAVYEKTNNYTTGSFLAPVNDNFGQLFATDIFADDSTSTVLVSSPGWKLPSGNSFGKIYVYRKTDTDLTKQFEYTLNDPATYCSTSKETDFGYALAYDRNKDLFIIGAPAASQVISSTSTNTVVLTTGTGVTKTFDREGLVKISTRNTNSNAETIKAVLVSPFAATSATAHNARFGHAIFVNQVNRTNTTTMLVSAPGTGTGRVYAFGINTATSGISISQHWNGFEIISTGSISLNNGSAWGDSIVGNFDGSLIAISAPRYSATGTQGIVQLFDKNHDWIQTISAPYATGEEFGYDLEMSNTGTFLFITSKDVKCSNLSYGKTYVYKLDGSINTLEITNTHVSSGTVDVYISAPDLYYGRQATAVAIKSGNAVSSVEIIDPGYGYTKPPTVAFSGTGVIINGSLSASVNNFYQLNQEIENPIYAADIRFGTAVSLSSDNSTLAISALGTNRTKFNSFDNDGNPTTFDNGSTDFYDSIEDSGTVYVYERLGDYFVLAEELNTSAILPGSKYGYSIKANNVNTYIGAPSSGGVGVLALETSTYITTASAQSLLVEFSDPDLLTGTKPTAAIVYNSLGATKTISSINITYSGRGYINTPTVLLKDAYGNTLDTLQVTMIDEQSRLYQFAKIDSNFVGWNKVREQENLVDINKFTRLALIDTENEEIVDYLDIIDPLKGKIAGPAERELKYKATFDPAIYSIGISPFTIDNNNSWLDDHVGELWWDLSTAKYKIYEQGDEVYRKNTWGQLFPGSTIDVYEWVSSTLLPSEWAAKADTNEGLTLGISGQPKYPSNNVISVKQVLNSITNSFENVYYYWVKNKVTVPDTNNRKISAYETARLIADPESVGYKFAQILSKDSLSLINVKDSIVSDRINLNIAYDNIDNTIPRHTEWLLLEEDNAKSVPSTLLEKKLFDSLLGRDSKGNLVPDSSLIERNRYGLSIRPQQTIFKNRIEALRNLIEYTNDVLLANRITGAFDLTRLQTQEEIPGVEDREYDGIVEDLVDLSFVDTIGLRPASAICSVQNGKIVGVTITDPGFGYKQPPKITIETDLETSVEIKTIIDAQGRVIDYTIEDAGNRFETAPTLKIRPHSYLVQANEDYNGRWTLHEFNYLQNDWTRVRTQSFNTELYWNYTDWISPNFNNSKNIAYTISGVYELATLENIVPGDYVKIRNGGDGRYIILERLESTAIGDFTLGYNIVYSENGTIQISNSIWDIANSNFGYDVLTLEETLFDQVPDVELANILQALRYDIFVKNLKVYWNKFFFVAVKYALSEQKLLDWAFKTSLISVVNDSGSLDQVSVYKFNKAENYESYLREVKPYHTQIKDYTSKHSTVDTYNGSITDFDLPFYYNSNTDSFESITLSNTLIDQVPYVYWKNNYKYGVERISIDNAGQGYTQVPTLVVTTATGDTGSGLKGSIYIKNGSISDIVITNSGQDYILPPILTIVGGGSVSTTATASAILGLNPVRKNKIEIKFDRYTRTNTIGSTATSDTFTCNGLVNEFELTWYADTDKITITPTLDGRLIYADDYEIIQTTRELPGYHKKISKFKLLNSVPTNGQILRVTYNKNVDLYTAIDRIDRFYNPDDGMLGDSYPQLMKGMEYPKTNIVGLGLNYVLPWTTSTQSLYGTSAYGETIDAHVVAKLTTTATIGTTTLYLSTTTGIQPGYIINVLNSSSNRVRTDTAVVSISGNSVVITAPSYDIKTTKSNALTTGSQITVKTKNPFNGQITKGDTIAIEDITTSEFNGFYIVEKIVNNNTLLVTATSVLSTNTAVITPQSNIRLCNVYTQIDVENELLETWTREITNTSTFSLDTYLYLDDIMRAEVVVNGVPAVDTPAFIPYFEIIESAEIENRAIIRVDSLTATIVNTVTFAVYGNPAVEFYKFNNNYSAVDTDLVGGGFTSTGLIGALGVNPEEIIIDGDKFLSENASYAPEEMIPGQVVDSLGINVYTKQNTGYPLVVTGSFPVLNTNTQNTATLGVEIGNFAGILINYNGQIFERVTSTNFVESNEYYIAGNTIIMPPQSVTGRAGYNLISIGSDNLIDGGQVSEISTASLVESLASIDDVASVFVLVNGRTVSDVPSTSTVYYTLEPVNDLNNRASVKVYNMQPRLNTVQAWFFNAEYPEFNRINEELITVGGSPTVSFALANPPFQAEPASAHAIVEIYDSSNPGDVRRLLPPWISYYQAVAGVNTFAVDNKNTRPPGTYNITNVLTYVNGVRLRPSFDFTVNSTNGTAIINAGLLTAGDAVAVMGLFDYDYYIDSGILKLDTAVSDSVIKVITFFDHDNLFMQTERFDGNISKRFTLNRRVLDDNHVWVSVNGIPLTSRYDYEIMDDFRSVQLADWVPLVETDDVVITSFGAPEFNTYVVGWRYFKDLFERTQYRRLAKYNTTELTRQLKAGDTEIHVVDSTKLGSPNPARNKPGVIIIDGERIEFFRKSGNVLTELRRSTLGTGPALISDIGTKVIDQSNINTIQYSDVTLIQNIQTTLTTTYAINTVTDQMTYGDGIVLDPALSAIDQLTVYYGGRQLRKAEVTVHDMTVSYDTTTNSLSTLGPEFSINTVTNEIVLNIAEGVDQNLRLTLVQRRGYVWTGTESILTSNVNQAVYLRDRQAELPDIYYYGGDPILTDIDSFAITEENGDPLEGF